jgi:hypothetical protein
VTTPGLGIIPNNRRSAAADAVKIDYDHDNDHEELRLKAAYVHNMLPFN